MKIKLNVGNKKFLLERCDSYIQAVLSESELSIIVDSCGSFGNYIWFLNGKKSFYSSEKAMYINGFDKYDKTTINSKTYLDHFIVGFRNDDLSNRFVVNIDESEYYSDLYMIIISSKREKILEFFRSVVEADSYSFSCITR